jgi:Uma2 family endonuclease
MSDRVLPIFRPEDSRRLVQSVPVPSRGEHRVVFSGMTWKDYLRFWNDAEEYGGFRASYLDGTIELMFPSYEHESRGRGVGYLIPAYCEHLGTEVFAHGSATLKAKLKAAGKEPDESFCFRTNKQRPDLAIEIALTSGGMETLEIYSRFSIPEVWIWAKGTIEVFVLGKIGYRSSPSSRCLPELDLKLLAECALVKGMVKSRRQFLRRLGANPR